MSSTSDEIKRVALRLLEKSGADAVSIRQVAATVGITPMAIYHHFKNRAALLDAVVVSQFEELEQAFTQKQLVGSLEQRLLGVLELYVDYAAKHPRVFDFLFAEKRPGARRYPKDFRARLSPTLNRIENIVRVGIASGELRDGDSWEISMCLWAHVHGHIMLNRAGRFELSPEEFVALVRRSIRSFLHGLQTPRSSPRR